MISIINYNKDTASVFLKCFRFYVFPCIYVFYLHLLKVWLICFPSLADQQHAWSPCFCPSNHPLRQDCQKAQSDKRVPGFPLQDPHHTIGAYRRLFPENPPTSQVLPTHGHCQGNASRGLAGRSWSYRVNKSAIFHQRNDVRILCPEGALFNIPEPVRRSEQVRYNVWRLVSYIAPLRYYASSNLLKFSIKFNPVEYINTRFFFF